MGRHFVPSEARTPAARARGLLDEAEKQVVNFRGTGAAALVLPRMLDRIGEMLDDLEAGGMDCRPERIRFENVQRQLHARRKRFVKEVGDALQGEREAVQPDRARWWWFLDEEVAEERRRTLRKVLIISGVVVVLLIVAAIILAPSADVVHGARGESLAQRGEFEAALAEFEAAAALAPENPDPWLWQGVIYAELGEPEKAEEAFDTARGLYETNYTFLLERARRYVQIGEIDAASADVEQAILEEPEKAVGYYMRHTVRLAQGDYLGAIDDLERTAELAHEAGDTWMEGQARVALAMLVQQGPPSSPLSPLVTPTPLEDETGG